MHFTDKTFLNLQKTLFYGEKNFVENMNEENLLNYFKMLTFVLKFMKSRETSCPYYQI